MATKAERFKADEQRKGQEPATRAKKPRVVAAATGARNASKHASRKAAYDLEETRASSTRPSRKSTRKSGNRQKHATQLKARQTMRTRSPRARAEKAQAANVK
jgi:hypothetical protein